MNLEACKLVMHAVLRLALLLVCMSPGSLANATASPSTRVFDFDVFPANWSSGGAGEFPWTLHTAGGRTPSQGTGAADGRGGGGYIFAEVSSLPACDACIQH